MHPSESIPDAGPFAMLVCRPFILQTKRKQRKHQRSWKINVYIYICAMCPWGLTRMVDSFGKYYKIDYLSPHWSTDIRFLWAELCSWSLPDWNELICVTNVRALAVPYLISTWPCSKNKTGRKISPVKTFSAGKTIGQDQKIDVQMVRNVHADFLLRSTLISNSLFV